MGKLIMMIGLPASGKSTLSKKYKEDGFIVHSSDEIRREISDINDQSKNPVVFDILHTRIKIDLELGKNVVYDATNLSMKRRRAFLETLNSIECSKVAVVMATPFNECIERDRSRDRTVGDTVLDRMYKSFQFPMLQEGFDDIEIIYNKVDYRDNFYITEQLDFLNSVNQYNKHHTLTIGKHCYEVFTLLSEENFNISYAGLLHDFGKVKTMSFKNYKGQYSNQSHYYGHESVSAYDAMFYLYGVGLDTNKVCQLITYHMRPHLMTTAKAINKFKRFVGEEFWEELLILNKADKEAR